MVSVRSFRAIRPTTDKVEEVSALPYDVMSTEEARQMVVGKPYSFLRISRPEVEFNEDLEFNADCMYSKTAENLKKFMNDGVLVEDQTPTIYLYREIMGDHTQVGIVACAHIDDYIDGRIKKHEFTRKDKEDDRARHVDVANAHTGPVFLAFRDDKTLAELMARDAQGTPLYDFVSEDNIRHTVWQVPTPEEYEKAFENIDATYIADGHHRAASAVRVGTARREKAGSPADAPYLHFLSVLFPASSLLIMPYNRVLKDSQNRSTEELVAELKKIGELTETTEKSPNSPGSYCIYIDKKWYKLTIPTESIPTDPVGSLDVDMLQKRVLSPIFDIHDPRTDKRIDFVGGIRGTDELERRVNSGEMRLAISMYPTQIGQIFDVADSGQVMPPKSTWFEPKLRSGLFVHSLG